MDLKSHASSAINLARADARDARRARGSIVDRSLGSIGGRDARDRARRARGRERRGGATVIIDATVVGRGARATTRRRARAGGRRDRDDDVGIDVARDPAGRIDARAGDGDAARVDVVQRRVVQRDERRGGERRRAEGFERR